MSNKQDPGAPDRREFMQIAAGAGAVGAAALGTSGGIQAASAALRGATRGTPRKKLVIVFLRGGADGVQLVPPTGDPTYYAMRPQVGVPQPGAGAVDEGLALDPSSPQQSPFSLHPSLQQLHARYTAAGGSDLAIIGAAGYVPPSRSHFQSQDIYETGSVGQVIRTGWVNRLLEVTPSAPDALIRALALRSTVPLSMRGPAPGAFGVQSTQSVIVPPTLRSTLDPIVQRAQGITDAGTGMYGSMDDALAVLDLFEQLDPTQFPPQNGAVYPAGRFSESLREVAQLIRADIGIDVFQVELGGWDHHSDIAPRIADLAAQLDGGIGSFLTDMGQDMSDVVLLTLTDFGRTLHENGSAGTDHGAAQSMFVVGGGVNGGDPGGGAQLYGWPGLQNPLDGRFLPIAVDYRNVVSEVLVRHLGMAQNDLAHVFPGLAYSPLGLL